MSLYSRAFPVLLLVFFDTFGFDIPTETSALPIVYINTNGQEINDDEEALSQFGIIDHGSNNSFQGDWNSYNGFAGIKYRGSSSADFEKKSFSIELQNQQGEEIKAPLLNMPKESEWALVPSFGDKTLIRNAFAYTMAAYSDHYAPRTRLVELVLNDSYEGVYLLVEKVCRDSLRVNVAKLDEDDSLGDSLTGGYILRIDRGSDNNGWYSSKYGNVYYQHYYPKDSKITDPQRKYIRAYIKNFEAMITGDQFADSTVGYSKWIAVRSFADYLLLQELVRNVDGYRLSAFLYKDKDSKGGKLHAGPVWDLDITSGNAGYYNGWDTEGWAYEFDANANNDAFAVPGWWPRLAKDSTFANSLNCRWKTLRQEAWSNTRWQGSFDSLASLAGKAQARNYQRWDIMNEKIWPEAYVAGSYSGEIDTMKHWLTARIAWMDEQFKAECIEPISSIHIPTPFAHVNPNGPSIVHGKLHWKTRPHQALLFNLRGISSPEPSHAGLWIVRWKDFPTTPWRSKVVSRLE